MTFEYQPLFTFVMAEMAKFYFFNFTQVYGPFAFFEKRVIGNVDGVSIDFYIGFASIII